MRRGPLIALITLFVLASYDFGVRPQRLVDSFKAMRCCAEHCRRSGNMSTAERCCGVAQDHAELRAVDTTSPDLDRVAAFVIADGLEPVSVDRPIQVVLVSGPETPRSPPVFLSNQSLLL